MKIFLINFDQLGFQNIEKYSPNELLNKQFNSVIEVFNEKNFLAE